MTKVKICGINSEAAFDAAVEAGADWIGFVFFTRSPRYVSPEAAYKLSARAKGGPARVGLFVDPTLSLIRDTVSTVDLDVFQIYRGPGMPVDTSGRFAQEVWRPIGVSTSDDLPLSADGADGLLIEARPPAGAQRPGGNAASFDWSIVRDWHPPAPWILAGGLTPENVGRAIAATGAKAVDVSSGVEVSPGQKDAALIRAFISNARNAGRGSIDLR